MRVSFFLSNATFGILGLSKSENTPHMRDGKVPESFGAAASLNVITCQGPKSLTSADASQKRFQVVSEVHGKMIMVQNQVSEF